LRPGAIFLRRYARALEPSGITPRTSAIISGAFLPKARSRERLMMLDRIRKKSTIIPPKDRARIAEEQRRRDSEKEGRVKEDDFKAD
ncbi:MAG: hypothetical protein LBS45_09645, partial [Synergistaceae bacterium]|jgi:hypothetical protein|nr:hypothetical protein [Synergistaceae bacterium]